MNHVAERNAGIAGATASENTEPPTPAARPADLAVLAAAIALTQAACGGGGEGGGTAAPTAAGGPDDAPASAPAPGSGSGSAAAPDAGSAAPASPAPEAITESQAAHFLLQAQFSASDADMAAVRQAGYAGWLDAQFAAAPGITGWDWLNARGYDQADEKTPFYDVSYPADHMIWHQLMTAPDPVRQRMALALSELFVVSMVGITGNWRSHMLAAFWDVLAAGAFGNYRQLLEDVTLNAAMGVYLNTKGNRKENASTGRQPDENYAREVMQLMSIGLYRLNPDGSVKTGAGGAKLESYNQSDVSNLARVFTGWDFDQSQNAVNVIPGETRDVGTTAYTRLPMALRANRHSTLEANFLGASVAAGTDGGAALKIALDTLFHHPNVGPFLGRQMIQRLVTSDPSPAYVARVAAAFDSNGAGVRGDLKAVWSAILLDPEARGPAGLTAPNWGKLREPMLRFVQWGRTFQLDSARGSWKIGDLSDRARRLGQSPLRSPSVFNFFRPGYVPPSTALAATESTAPEFQIVSETSVGGYLNYMQNVIRRGIYVTAPDRSGNGNSDADGYDIQPDYGVLLPLVNDASALVAKVNLLLAAGQVSDATRKLIADAIDATPLEASSNDGAKADRIAAAIFMTMASAEYLIQK